MTTQKTKNSKIMTNKQFKDGRTIYHLKFKNETDPLLKNKYYSSLTAMVKDNDTLDRSLSFFQKFDWDKGTVDTDNYQVIKSKMKSTSNL